MLPVTRFRFKSTSSPAEALGQNYWQTLQPSSSTPSSLTPNQPSLRCRRTLWERISADCTMKNTTHVGNTMGCTDKGWERRRMYQVMVDGVAEAGHHSRSDKQRHEEIKVLTPRARTLGHHLFRQRVRFRAHFCGGGREDAFPSIKSGIGASRRRPRACPWKA
jgi:hypothetical protein